MFCDGECLSVKICILTNESKIDMILYAITISYFLSREVEGTGPVKPSNLAKAKVLIPTVYSER